MGLRHQSERIENHLYRQFLMVGSYLLVISNVRSKWKWLFSPTKVSCIAGGLLHARLCVSPESRSVFTRNDHLTEENAVHMWMGAMPVYLCEHSDL